MRTPFGSGRKVAAIALTLAALMALPAQKRAAADVYPQPHVPSSGRGSIGPRQDVDEPEWRRARLLGDLGIAFPEAPSNLATYWNPGGVIATGSVTPIRPILDLVFRISFSTMKLDEDRFREDFGIPDTEDHDALFLPITLDARLHRERVGFRPFAGAGIGYMAFARPEVRYVDASGTTKKMNGAPLFQSDGCYSLSPGIEWLRDDRKLGGYMEAQWMSTVGFAETPHAYAALRLGIEYRLMSPPGFSSPTR